MRPPRSPGSSLLRKLNHTAKTPGKDFNVPVTGSEQMYQALESLGVDTQLIVYPGQFHGLTIPSYQRDRLDRYLKWWGQYLNK